MAGQYVNIIVPGYSSLYVRDLSYTAGSGETGEPNPFNPDSDRPLVEGEWLERSGADKVTRGGNNAMASSGFKDNGGTVPAFLYFNERGRYDVQLTKRAHIIQGPAGFEFRTRLCTNEAFAVGDAVAVFDFDGPSGEWGVVRRVLGRAIQGTDAAATYVIGRVTRVFGTSDIAVMYNPEGRLG